MDANSPPLVNFAFTNPGGRRFESKGTPTPRDYPSEASLDHSNHEYLSGRAEELTSPSPSISYGQLPSKKLKPGPISRSELSSTTNAFKLRTEDPHGLQNSTSSTRLRQEVFKKPHTLAPSPKSLDVATARRFAPASVAPSSGDPVLKVSDKQVAHIRAPSSNTSLSPFLKSEPAPFPDAIRPSGTINAGQRRKSNAHHKSNLLSRSTALSLIEEPDAHIQSEDLSPADVFSSSLDTSLPHEPRYHTPSRGCVFPTTPSSEKSTREDIGEVNDLRKKCEFYEVEKKYDRNTIASQSQTIEELSNKNAQMEEKTRHLETKYADEVKKITQRADASLATLSNLHEKFSQTSASQIEELKQNLDTTEPLLAGYDKMKTTLRGIAEEYEQQMQEHTTERTKLQQTNDLLRDQLSDRTGSYTESLDREKELQVSLITLGESHANVAKSLSSLHEQYNLVTTKYADSRLAESTATKHVEELEGTVTSLKIEHARVKSLLTDNEQAFSRKLHVLEEESDSMRASLEGAHRELGVSKNGEQVARSQAQALLQEKEDLLQSNAMLERDLSLKGQSLDESRARIEVLERQLCNEKRNLEKARTENGQTMGQLAEKERATSAQIRDLNKALESHRERESTLIGEIATLNALASTLREKANEADKIAAEHRVLEKNIMEKQAEIERIEIENGQLQSQVVQLELTRDASNEEIKQLRETSCVARERETAARKELHELKQSLEEYRAAGDDLRKSIARMEAEIEQIKMALEKEQNAHKLTEKQHEASSLSLNKLQGEQKGLLDKASTAEKKLRSSVEESQERIKKLEMKCAERENEIKRLRNELDASNSAKATLEGLASEFRNSVQQARSQREKIEAQESKLTTLGSQVSSQKTELRLLEQQLANSEARLAESKADASAHRAAAESARASAAVVEGQLKQKEQDLEAIREELQSRQLPQIDAATDNSLTSSLPNKILEQEEAIKSLRSQIFDLEKSSETLVERYKGGKLTNSEKDLVGVITAGIVQEKNRTINNLKGELKRKENEAESNKTTIANLKDSLTELKAQLEPNQAEDPAGWNSFVREQMTISSSPLSDAVLNAPDHDPPAPDSPAIQLAERATQDPRGPLPERNPQQHRTVVPARFESGNATDEIQEFEEPKTPHNVGVTTRKRTIVTIEPLDDEDQEDPEHGTKRKIRVKAKKDNKAVGDSNGSKGQPNKTDGPSASTKGKATKRRKV